MLNLPDLNILVLLFGIKKFALEDFRFSIYSFDFAVNTINKFYIFFNPYFSPEEVPNK